MQPPKGERCVFQTNPPRANVTYADVSEALDATHKLRYKDKVEYFYCRGIDYQSVIKYYDVMIRMEASIEKDQPFRTFCKKLFGNS